MLLNKYGFSNVYGNAHAINPMSFMITFKGTVVGCLSQKLFRMLESPVLSVYKEFKRDLGTKII